MFGKLLIFWILTSFILAIGAGSLDAIGADPDTGRNLFRQKLQTVTDAAEDEPQQLLGKLDTMIQEARSQNWDDLVFESVARQVMAYASLEKMDEAFALSQEYLPKFQQGYEIFSLAIFLQTCLRYYDAKYDRENIKKFRNLLEGLLPKTSTFEERDKIYQGLAHSYVDAREYPKAFDYLKILLSEAETSGNLIGIEATNNEIAIIYDNTGDHATAIEYFRKALGNAQKSGRRFNISIYLYNLGTSYKAMDDIENALKYFREALQLSEELDDKAGIAEAYFQIGTSEKALGNLDAALRALNKSLQLSQSLGKSWLVFQSAIAIIDIQMKKDNFAVARRLFESQSVYIHEIDHPRILEKYHSMGMEIESRDKNFVKAFHHAKEYMNAHDKMRDTAQSDSLNTLKVQFDAEQKSIENRLLKSDNALKELTIQNQKRQNTLLVAGIVLATVILLIIAWLLRNQIRLRKLVQRKEQQITRIIKHVHAGIFVLERNGIIAPNYSPASEVLLGQKQLAGQSFFDVMSRLSLDTDLSDTQKAFEAVYGADEITFDMNSHLFMQEGQIQVAGKKKHLAFSWTPIPDGREQTISVLLTMNDISQIDDLRSREHLHADQALFVQLVEAQGFHRLSLRLHEIKNSLTLIQNAMGEISQQTRIKRDLHTLKGNCRTLGLMEAAKIFHEVEDLFQDRGKHLDVKQHFSHILEQIDKLTSIAQMMQKKLQEDADHHADFDLANMKQGWQKQAESAAALAGKVSPTIELSGSTLGWPAVYQIALDNALGHLINNSLAHGIEAPAERQLRNKPIQGQIRLESRVTSQAYSLRFSDDGGGLHLPTIEALAIKRSLIKEKHGLNRLQLASLILADNFSTAKTLSELAGRGVGLAAVKQEIEQHGGRLNLILGNEDSDGKVPVIFEIIIPRLTAVA